MRPLTAQRLLLCGLVAVMALSAGLLWMLRSGATRGRASGDAPEHAASASELADPARDALAPATSTAGEPARAEVAGDAPGAETAEDEEAAFDPGALSGRVLGDGAGI